MSSKPKLTNPLRPAARYRKGQAPTNLPLSDSDEDDSAQQQQGDPQQEDEPISDDENPAQGSMGGRGGVRGPSGQLKVSLREVEVDQSGQVRVRGRTEVGRTAEESSEEDSEDDDQHGQPQTRAGPTSGLKSGRAEDEESSSEYETDSEEEEAPKPIYKPMFVSKRNRDTIAERDKELDPEVIEARRVAEADARKKVAHDLVADSIVRELAAKDAKDVTPDIDDTDGLDPAAEFEEWKLRELTRIKRDREAAYAREKEREEVEARRALPEALRLKEDTERAKASRQNKQKGNQVFGQKYHHKGAFYTDAEILTKHDYSAPTVSTVRNMESLPAAMQKRNFGKASQSKYTHLAAEDTTRAQGGGGWDKKAGQGAGAGGGCFSCGGAHLKRDCPQAGGVAGPSGTNGGGPPGAEPTRDAGWASRPPPNFRPAATEQGGAGPRGGDRQPPPPSRGSDRHDDRDRFAGRRDDERERHGAASRRDEGDRYGSRELRRDERRGEERDWRERGGDRRGEEDRRGERHGGERRRSRSRSPGRDRPPHRDDRDRDDKRRRYD